MCFPENYFFSSQIQVKEDWRTPLLAVPPQSIPGLWPPSPSSRPCCPGSRYPPQRTELQGLCSPPFHSTPPLLPLPYVHLRKLTDQGIISWMRKPRRERFSYWLHVWQSRAPSLYFFLWWFIQGSSEMACWGTHHCPAQALIGVIQPGVNLWLEASSLPPCHSSPKLWEEDFIVPGVSISMKSFSFSVKSLYP